MPEMMLRLNECQDDAADMDNAKANIVLSSGQNKKRDREQILFNLDRCIKRCSKSRSYHDVDGKKQNLLHLRSIVARESHK